MTVGGTDALEQALALHASPDRVPLVRSRPLPEAMLQLIRIAAGDDDAVMAASGQSAENPRRIVDAARFYIQQVQFHEDADSYRVLGVRSDAADATIKEHYRWLTRWLHPDRQPERWDVVYAERVNRAWKTLNSEQRRREYDARQLTEVAVSEHAFPGLPRHPPSLPTSTLALPRLSPQTISKMPAYVLGGMAVLALGILTLWSWSQHEQQLDESLASDHFDALGQEDAASAQEAAIRQRIAFDERVAELSQPITAQMPVVHPRAAALPKKLPSSESEGAEHIATVTGVQTAQIAPTSTQAAARMPAPLSPQAPAPRAMVVQDRSSIVQAARRDVSIGQLPTLATARPAVPQRQAATSPKRLAVPVSRESASPEAASPGPVAAAVQRDVPDSGPAARSVAANELAAAQEAAVAVPAVFAAAYAKGDLTEMMRLFTRDAADNRGGIDAIVEDYRHLFDGTSSRELDLSRVEWQVQSDRIVGSGTFHARVRRNGDMFSTRVQGWIHIEAVPRNGGWKIQRILHRNKE